MTKNVIVSAVVALLLSLGVGLFFIGQVNQSNLSNGDRLGSVRTLVDDFTQGAKLGDQTVVWKTVTIGPTKNQAAWKNNLGFTVYADRAEIGFTSGTASSTYNYYVATSSSSTISDYSSPSNTFFLVNGGVTSTSSKPAVITSTTTTNGLNGTLPVKTGEYLVWDIQEAYACKTVGSCETATSTNRGITNFFGKARLHY